MPGSQVSRGLMSLHTRCLSADRSTAAFHPSALLMSEYKKKILRGSVKFVTSLPPPGPGKDFLSRTFLFYMNPDVNLGLPWPGSMECSLSLHHSLPMETLPQEAQEAHEPQEANRRRKWKCEPWVPFSNIKEKKK